MRTRILTCLLFLAPASCLLAGNESNYTYLALGDSIAFGLDPTLVPPGLPLPPATQFTGYPEIVAQVEHLLQSKKEVSAACPGQTSTSFFVPNAPDNGCNSLGPQGQLPFKTNLHTNYPGTQLEFAVSQLARNKHINLVTLGIGGNDLLMLANECGGPSSHTFLTCVGAALGTAAMPGPFLQTYAGNLIFILSEIRQYYKGTLVLVENYSPSADPLFTLAVSSLNAVMTQVGSQFNVKFANAFQAFQVASAFHGGDPCAAGLLIRVSQTACDVDPSPAGRDLIAGTVVLATR